MNLMASQDGGPCILFPLLCISWEKPSLVTPLSLPPACALTTMPGSNAHPQEVLLLTAGLPHSWVLCVASPLTPCLAQRLVSSVR